MPTILDVWLFNYRVGTLSFTEGRLNFCYLDTWIDNPNAIALSCSLPLQSEIFNDHQSRPFFGGLLPEGNMRKLLAKQFHVSPQNEFALLDRLGGECAGAITFLAHNQFLTSSNNEDIEWLNNDQLIDILDQLPTRPMLAGKDDLRLSLAGAQDKLPVIYDGERIGLTHNNTPSSHILKPSIPTISDSVINEGFCLALADALNLNPAKSNIHTLGEKQFLLVERYDRKRNSHGNLERLHQEDFCQALGVQSEMKYQNEGGPNLSQCFELVRRMTRPSAPQILTLLDYMIFNTLIGNHDAHAKNFSLLYRNKTSVVAPLYDVLSTTIYPTLSSKMAMKSGNTYKFNEVQARHWDQFAQSGGLSATQTKKRVLELTKKLPIAAKTLQSSNYLFKNNPTIEKIINVIEERSSMTNRRLQ
jgi:serine/threonine-protein kinase HipA